uniref:Zinc finger protein 365 n=1 Tax=Amphilophus citrinellus TaxID=61819 RepID=A0A3Q0RTC4_AMPCI
MQQKLCSRGSGSFLLERNGQACGAIVDSVTPCDLPFRCPRCGEQERFRSLASLRAHLEYRHSYLRPPPPHQSPPSPVPTSGSSWPPTGPGPGTGSDWWVQVSGAEPYIAVSECSCCICSNFSSFFYLPEQNSYSGLETAAASAAVRQRLASILRAADSTMQRRLAKVSTELAQTDTELLCERAHSQHLAQERQEVADRERSLSRQVDVAVMVIAALREQLNASENELERREREVLTIQKFLEAAVRQETCGKVRIQRFIENLLRRIALAERLVEYYQVNGSGLINYDTSWVVLEACPIQKRPRGRPRTHWRYYVSHGLGTPLDSLGAGKHCWGNQCLEYLILHKR